MSAYINVVAKRGSGDQINKLWNQKFADNPSVDSWLVYTKAVIKNEIKYIQGLGDGDSQAHLKPRLKTVENWNNIFPSMSEGSGQIFIKKSKLFLDDEEFSQEYKDSLIAQVKFILDNRFLFQEISGLDYARDYLEVDVPGDTLDERGQVQQPEKALDFSDLPVNTRSKIYNLCVEHNRPDIWKGYLAYKENPEQVWSDFRHKVLPWTGRFGRTVWQLCEQAATERDGEDYGLMGRFRDGKFPTEFDLQQAMLTPVNLQEFPVEKAAIPEYLYHATYSSSAEKILEEGLIPGKGQPNWSDSNDRVVCLSADPEVAYSFCEDSDLEDHAFLNNDEEDILVFQINTENLCPDLLFFDRNDLDAQNNGNFEYHGAISKDALKIVFEDQRESNVVRVDFGMK